MFSPTRPSDQPLIIGSIKSNIGHSEPTAGSSGLLKSILSIEKGIIPGHPTFETPNPNIKSQPLTLCLKIASPGINLSSQVTLAVDFEGLRVRATRTKIPWPKVALRRASVNSFGYGGSNTHVIVDDPKAYLSASVETHVSSFVSEDDDNFFAEEEIATRPYTLVFSANDEGSL